MARPLPIALALLLIAAVVLGLWLWQPDAPPVGPGRADGSELVDPATAALDPAAVDQAGGGSHERAAANPNATAPTFVVEGLVLADRLRPDLSDVRVVAYRGEPTDSSGMMMSGLGGPGASPAFILRGEPIADAAVDGLGNFVLRAETADLRLSIEHDLYVLPMPEIAHVPTTTGSQHVVLAPVLGACVRGRLFGDRATEVTEVRINLEPDPMSMMRDPRLFLGAMLSGRSARTPDATGAFEFRGLIPGASFVLTARGPSAFANMPQHQLLAGETREVALAVQSAASLTVAVVDAAGKPIPEAMVSVRPLVAPSTMFPQLHSRRGETAADGRCVVDSLQPTRVAVEAMATGFVAAEATVELRTAPETNELTLTLGEGGIVTGTVRRSDGKPVAGARVAHHPMTEIPLIGDMAAQLGSAYLAQIANLGAETDADGRFRLTGLADNDAFLVVAAHPDYGASYTKGVRMGDTGVEVTLLDLGAVTGQVVAAEDQQPIETFTVRVLKTMFLVMRAPVHTEVVTSPDGTFRLPTIPPGSYTLSVQADGRSVANKDLTFESGGADLGVIELARGAAIHGRVRDENGKPVPGALVRRRQGPLAENPMIAMFAGESDSARTDAEGRYRIEQLPPGGLQLLASAEGYASGRSERVEVEAGQRLKNVDITLGHGGSIVGRLRTGPGETAADFMLMAQEQRTQVTAIAELAEDGSFALANLDPGNYVVQAMPNRVFADIDGQDWKPGEGINFGEMFQKITDSVVSERCTVRGGETTEVELDASDLVLGTRWTVRVEVGGKPMPSGLVEAIALDSGRMRAAMFSNGRAILGNVEPGPYTLQVRSGLTMAPVGSPQTVEFPVGVQEHRSTLSLPGGELHGRVVDANSGEPLRAALVRLIHEDAAERDDAIGMALTDPNGHFAFTGLEDGDYGVVAAEHLGERETSAAQRRIRVAAGVQAEPIELRARAAASASVRITTSSGAPVVGATALCVDPSGRPIGALGIAVTDPDGRAWFGGMPHGDARVVARAPGLAPGASEVRPIDPQGTVEFSLILTSGTRTTLRAVDGGGLPLNGATISARYDAGPWLPAMLLIEHSGAGTYELGRLGSGVWEFRVHHPATGTMTQRRTIGSESAITVVVAPQ